SFDEYFGTYPGADGIPAGVCLPDPTGGACTKPYHDPSDVNRGGPHQAANAAADIAGGKMDGFVGQGELGLKGCKNPLNPKCGGGTHVDVMGYKTGQDIPNYWAYAKSFVLQDRMFESARSWSLPSRLFMVSGWSAQCSSPSDASACSSRRLPLDTGTASP